MKAKALKLAIVRRIAFVSKFKFSAMAMKAAMKAKAMKAMKAKKAAAPEAAPKKAMKAMKAMKAAKKAKKGKQRRRFNRHPAWHAARVSEGLRSFVLKTQVETIRSRRRRVCARRDCLQGGQRW